MTTCHSGWGWAEAAGPGSLLPLGGGQENEALSRSCSDGRLSLLLVPQLDSGVWVSLGFVATTTAGRLDHLPAPYLWDRGGDTCQGLLLPAYAPDGALVVGQELGFPLGRCWSFPLSWSFGQAREERAPLFVCFSSLPIGSSGLQVSPVLSLGV